MFNTLFWVYTNLFPEETDKTRKYSKSAIFVWYENGRRRLQGAQRTDTERTSLNIISRWGTLLIPPNEVSLFNQKSDWKGFEWALGQYKLIREPLYAVFVIPTRHNRMEKQLVQSRVHSARRYTQASCYAEQNWLIFKCSHVNESVRKANIN